MSRPDRGVPPDVAARYILPGDNRSGGAPPSGPQVTGITVLRYPPTIYPIPDARGFALFDQVDTIGVNTTYTPAGLSLAMPQGYTGVVRSVTIDVNDLTAATDVRYVIRIGGAAVPGYNDLRQFPRAAASVSRDFEAFIVIPDGQTVDMQFLNITGGANKMGALLTGWSWPSASGRRWIGEA